MGCLGRFATDILVSRVRAQFDVLRPCNLTILADMHRPKERFIGENCENPVSNVGRKINDPLHSVRILQADTIAWQSLYFCRSHGQKVPPRASLCKPDSPGGRNAITAANASPRIYLAVVFPRRSAHLPPRTV